MIVDDGSHDNTPQIADLYERRYPGIVRAIHQENKGHGGAVNTGVAEASGVYVKVVDSDDWIGAEALERVMETLRTQVASGAPIDLLVTDYVYDKVGKRVKHVVDFKHVMKPTVYSPGTISAGSAWRSYMIMHTLTFRTEVVRASGMQLPEHTFYVDFIYSYHPFPWGQDADVPRRAVLPLFHRPRGAERADRRDDPPRQPAASWSTAACWRPRRNAAPCRTDCTGT